MSSSQQYSLFDVRSLHFSECVHNQLVRKNHKLISAANEKRMTLNEQRLLALGLTKLPAVSKGKEIELAGNELCVEVSAKEFGDAFNLQPSARYRDLYDAYERLKLAKVEWETPATTRRKARNRWETILTGGSRPQNVEEASGYVELKFNPVIVPSLMMDGHYVLYRLGETIAFTRHLSHRLYDIGRKMLPYKSDDLSWSGGKWMIDEFRKLVGMTDAYDSYGGLSKHVLRPAVAEINQRTFGLQLEYGPVTRGRKTTGIQIMARRKTVEEMRQVRQWRAGNGYANLLAEGAFAGREWQEDGSKAALAA